MTFRLLQNLLRPFALRALDWLALDDPWKSLSHQVPPWLFAAGMAHDYATYLTGPSNVSVRSLDDVCSWLLNCRYASDQELFGKVDYWQLPDEFETRRAGDCDDHAVWAWRKLIDLGQTPLLVSGRRRTNDGGWDGHAWVSLTIDGQPVILEAAEKDPGEMVVPFEAHRAALRPHFAVDKDLKRHVYDGYLLTLRERRRSGVATA
jgi:hypothetical protein